MAITTKEIFFTRPSSDNTPRKDLTVITILTRVYTILKDVAFRDTIEIFSASRERLSPQPSSIIKPGDIFILSFPNGNKENEIRDALTKEFGLTIFDNSSLIKTRTQSLLKPGHIKIGGEPSHMPLESLFIYETSVNTPLQTLRGDTTYLPGGQSILAYEIGLTFNNIDDINNILRRWISTIHHSPILEIQQEDIAILSAMDVFYQGTMVVDRGLDPVKSKSNDAVIKILNEITNLVDAEFTTILAQINQSGHSENPNILSDKIADLKVLFSSGEDYRATRVATSSQIQINFQRIVALRDYFLNRWRQVGILLDQLLLSRLNLYQVGNQVDLFLQTARQSIEENEGLQRTVYGSRIMVAVQRFSVTTIEGSPGSLYFSATFLRFNHNTIMPGFDYYNQAGEKVDHVEESAFYDWVGKSLVESSGIRRTIEQGNPFQSTNLEQFKFEEYASGTVDDPGTFTIFIPVDQSQTTSESPSVSLFNLNDTISGTIASLELNLEGSSSVTGISVSTDFHMTPIPMESEITPIFQYTGTYASNIQITVSTIDKGVLRTLNEIPRIIASKAKRLTTSLETPYIVIENSLLNMLGVRECIVQSVQTTNDPKSINNWIASIQFVKVNSNAIRKLHPPVVSSGKFTYGDYTKIFYQMLIDKDKRYAALAHLITNTCFSKNVYSLANSVSPTFGSSLDILAKLEKIWGDELFSLNAGAAVADTDIDLYYYGLNSGLFSLKEPGKERYSFWEGISKVTTFGQGLNVKDLTVLVNNLEMNLYYFPTISRYFSIIASAAVKDTAIGPKFDLFPFIHAEKANLANRFSGAKSNVFPARIPYSLRKIEEFLPQTPIDLRSRVKGTRIWQETIDSGFDGFVLRPRYQSVEREIVPSNNYSYANVFIRTIENTIGVIADLLLSSANGEFSSSSIEGVQREQARRIKKAFDRDWLRSFATDTLGDNFISDHIAFLIPRFIEILRIYAQDKLSLDYFSTESVLTPTKDKNLSAYPDMRLPKYSDYPYLFKEKDRVQGKTLNSFMSPDWFYSYEEFDSIRKKIYNDNELAINNNVEFGKQLLLSRYSLHDNDETSSGKITIKAVSLINLIRGTRSFKFGEIDIARSDFIQSLQEAGLEEQALKAITENVNDGDVFIPIRIKGIFSLDSKTINQRLTTLKFKLGKFSNKQDPSVKLSADKSAEQAQINEEIKRLTALANLIGTTSKSSEEIWRSVVLGYANEQLINKQPITLTLPLAALSYLTSSESVSTNTIAAECEPLKQRALQESNRVQGRIVDYQEPSIVINPADSSTNDSFILNEYSNHPDLIDNPFTAYSAMKFNGLGTTESFNKQRAMADRDSEKLENFGFKTCFPTYFIMFYNEEGDVINQIYDFYSLSGLIDLQVRHDKVNPVSVAALTFANPFNELFRHEERMTTLIESGIPESRTEKVPLMPGMGIQIKLGYDANPENLETVFTGQVTEVSYGNQVQVVCQSWGIELLNQTGEKGFFDQDNFSVIPKTIRDGVINQTGSTLAGSLLVLFIGLIKTGKSKASLFHRLKVFLNNVKLVGKSSVWFYIIAIALSYVAGRYIDKIFRDSIAKEPNPELYQNWEYYNRLQSVLEQYLAEHVLSDIRIIHYRTPFYLGTDFMSPANENIFFPMHADSWLSIANTLIENPETDFSEGEIKKLTTRTSSELLGREFEFLFKNMSPWEALQQLSWRFPHLDIGIRPYDLRATVFVGRPDLYYKFTEARDEVWQEWINKSGGASRIAENKQTIALRQREFVKAVQVYALGVSPQDVDEFMTSTVRNNEAVGGAARSVLLANISDWFKRDWVSLKNLFGPRDNPGVAITGFSLSIDLDEVEKRLQIIGEYINLRDNKVLNSPSGDSKYYRSDKLGLLTKASLPIAGLENLYSLWVGLEESNTDYYKIISESPQVRPYRRYHILSSTPIFKNIVSNSISASREGVYNEIKMGVMNKYEDVGIAGNKNPSTWSYITVVADPYIEEQNRSSLHVQSRTSSDMEVSRNIATSILKMSLANMYKGEIISLGTPGAFPDDRIMLADSYNSMGGFCDIRAVNHRFSRSDGFLTSFEPGLISYAKDSIGYLSFMNQKNASTLKFWSPLLAGAGIAALGLGGPLGWISAAVLTGSGITAGVSSSQILSEGYSEWSGKEGGRNIERYPLILCPLVQNSSLMLAGVDGIRWDIYPTNRQIEDAQTGLIDRFFDFINIAYTGWDEVAKTRLGIYMPGIGKLSIDTIRNAQFNSLKYRLSLPSNDEQVSIFTNSIKRELGER